MYEYPIEKLKPAREGLIVRDPDTLKALSQKGEAKRLTTYWRRRLLAGEVVKVGDKPRKKEAAKQPAKES